MMVPPGVTASLEDEPLDANIGPLVRPQLDPVSVDLDSVIEVRVPVENPRTRYRPPAPVSCP